MPKNRNTSMVPDTAPSSGRFNSLRINEIFLIRSSVSVAATGAPSTVCSKAWDIGLLLLARRVSRLLVIPALSLMAARDAAADLPISQFAAPLYLGPASVEFFWPQAFHGSTIMKCNFHYKYFL
jgi:hypothetical protein